MPEHDLMEVEISCPIRSIYRISVAVTNREEYENYAAFVSPTKEETTKAIDLVGKMLSAGGKALDMDKDVRMEIYNDGVSGEVWIDHSSLNKVDIKKTLRRLATEEEQG